MSYFIYTDLISKLQLHTMKSMKALQQSKNALVCFIEYATLH